MREVGCTLVSIVGLMVIGFLMFVLLIFGNFDKFTNSEAAELIEREDYINLEKYLFDTDMICHISYMGDPLYRQQNVWRVNDFLLDYDTSMIVIDPNNHFYFSSTKRSASTKYISFNNKAAIDTLLGKNFNFDSLKAVAQKLQDIDVISVSKYDSGGFIEFRLQYSSPISIGFGILSARSPIETKNRKHIYDELIEIDSTHYRFLEHVE